MISAERASMMTNSSPLLVLTRDLGMMRAPLADYLSRARDDFRLLMPTDAPIASDGDLDDGAIVLCTIYAYRELRGSFDGWPSVRFIVIVDVQHFRPELVWAVRDADALVGSQGDADAILTAIDAVHRGDGVVDKTVFDMVIGALRDREVGRRELGGGGSLTDRESEIINLVGDGHANKSIARTLGISVVTVNAHLRSIYTKLGARNRMDAVNRWKVMQGEAPDEVGHAAATPALAHGLS
jgi:DNA-binding NarL/FixJ family response regulator